MKKVFSIICFIITLVLLLLGISWIIGASSTEIQSDLNAALSTEQVSQVNSMLIIFGVASIVIAIVSCWGGVKLWKSSNKA